MTSQRPATRRVVVVSDVQPADFDQVATARAIFRKMARLRADEFRVLGDLVHRGLSDPNPPIDEGADEDGGVLPPFGSDEYGFGHFLSDFRRLAGADPQRAVFMRGNHDRNYGAATATEFGATFHEFDRHFHQPPTFALIRGDICEIFVGSQLPETRGSFDDFHLELLWQIVNSHQEKLIIVNTHHPLQGVLDGAEGGINGLLNTPRVLERLGTPGYRVDLWLSGHRGQVTGPSDGLTAEGVTAHEYRWGCWHANCGLHIPSYTANANPAMSFLVLDFIEGARHVRVRRFNVATETFGKEFAVRAPVPLRLGGPGFDHDGRVETHPRTPMFYSDMPITHVSNQKRALFADGTWNAPFGETQDALRLAVMDRRANIRPGAGPAIAFYAPGELNSERRGLPAHLAGRIGHAKLNDEDNDPRGVLELTRRVDGSYGIETFTDDSYRQHAAFSAGIWRIDNVPVSAASVFALVRASAGTRINAEGFIEEMASNIARIDYRARSNDPRPPNKMAWTDAITNSVWRKVRATAGLSATDNVDGGDAFDLTVTATVGSHRIEQLVVVAANTVYCYAIDVLSGGDYDYAALNFNGMAAFGGEAACYFDLAAGTVLSKPSRYLDAGVIDLGGGWYRIWCSVLSRLTGSSTGVRAYAAVDTGGGTVTVTFDGATFPGTITFARPQLEISITPGAYEANEELQSALLPRGLLVEPQSTNMILRNAAYDHATWAKSECAIGAAGVPDPAGADAQAIVITGPNSSVSHSIQQSVAVTNGTKYVLSAYVQRRDYRYCALAFASGPYFGFTGSVRFDMDSGEIFYPADPHQYLDAGAEYFGDGWWRFWVAAQALSTGSTTAPRVYPAVLSGSAPTTSFNGQTNPGSMPVWGVQMEAVTNDDFAAGRRATSVILTAASQVTRLLDEPTLVGVTDTLDTWITDGDGRAAVWRAEAVAPGYWPAAGPGHFREISTRRRTQ